MDANIKAEWVKRLRSGEYKQGTGALKHDSLGETKHCCLGVLCEIAAEAGIVTERKGKDGARLFSGKASFLPFKVTQWAGMEGDEGRGGCPTIYPLVADDSLFRYEDGRDNHVSLVDMNDGGFTFDQITDVIEWGM